MVQGIVLGLLLIGDLLFWQDFKHDNLDFGFLLRGALTDNYKKLRSILCL